MSTSYAFTLALPFVLQLPDGLYEGRYGLHAFHIALKRVPEQASSTATTTAEVLFNPNTGELTSASSAEVPGALTQYTIASIRFAREELSNASDQKVESILTGLALTFLNQLIDTYRFLTQSTSVRPMTPSEFHQVRAGRALHFRTSRVVDGKGQMSMGVLFRESEPIRVTVGQATMGDVQAAVRTHLAAGQTPTLENLLLLNARSHLASGEYKFAILDVSTALDIVVESRARKVLIAEGEASRLELDKLEELPTSQILKRVLLPRLAPEVNDLSLYEEWHKRWRPLRNRVVHDGYTPSQDEAEECAVRIEAFFHWIRPMSPHDTSGKSQK